MKYEAQIAGKERTIEDPDVVDMMKVGSKIRYADRQGSQSKLDDGRILGISNLNGGPYKVIVKTLNGSKTFPNTNYADTHEGDVWLSGPGWMECLERAQIIRVRQLLV